MPRFFKMIHIFKKNIGARIVVLLESFPFFMTGKIAGIEPGVVVIGAQEGIPIQLVGRNFKISIPNIAAFFIEDDEHPIPVLDSFQSLAEIQLSNDTALDKHDVIIDLDDAGVEIKESLKELEGQDVLFVLRPRQLSILGQVFRPILVARLRKAGQDFVFLKDVNIRFSNAPDFVFPLPLFVPNRQIAAFLPFDRQVQFPLT